MSTTSLNAELFRELSYIADNENSMRKLLKYVKKLVSQQQEEERQATPVVAEDTEEYRPLNPDSRNPEDYGAAVEQMKDFIAERGEWMDEHIDILRQYGHPSKNKKYNH